MENLLDIPALASEDATAPTKRRRSRLKVAVVAAVVLPVTAIVAAYALFFTPDSVAELRLSTEPGDAALAVPTGTWSVGAGSVAGYRVREKLLRLPASNDGVGRTNAVTGSFRLHAEGDGFRVDQGMRVVVDVSTLQSDEARRDDHMRTMGIETDLFPTATFVTTSEIALPASLVSGGQASVNVKGDLAIHGVTRTVTVPVRAQHTGGRIEVVGTLSFPWSYFDMKQPNLSYVTVEADPTLEFQVFFDHGQG